MTEQTDTADDLPDVTGDQPEPDADPTSQEAGSQDVGHGGDQADADTDAAEGEQADTFPRSYVERLRRENQTYRDRAADADTLARRLHTELVRATGRLADPTDLRFDAEHLADADALAAAIDALLTDKPHLANRRPVGDIGQGNRGPAVSGFSLLDTLKGAL